MEYLKGYRVFRDDPEWTNKVLIGSLVLLSTMIIPLVGQLALIGWQAMIMRRALHGQDAPLPRLEFDMDYLGKLVGLGFKGLIARFLWTLPVIAVVFGLVFCLWMGLIGLATGGIAAASQTGEGGLAALGPIGMICCGGVGYLSVIVLAVVGSIPASVAAMRAELCDDLKPAMQFGEVMDFTKKNFGELLKGTLVLAVVGGALNFVGALFCFVGMFPVAIVGLIAQAHFYAQVYRRHVEAGGQALPVAGPELTPPQMHPPASF